MKQRAVGIYIHKEIKDVLSQKPGHVYQEDLVTSIAPRVHISKQEVANIVAVYCFLPVSVA